MSAIEGNLAEKLMPLRARARNARGVWAGPVRDGLLLFAYLCEDRLDTPVETLRIGAERGDVPEALLERVFDVLPTALHPFRRIDEPGRVTYLMRAKFERQGAMRGTLRKNGMDTGCVRCGWPCTAAEKARGQERCDTCLGGKESRCRACGQVVQEEVAYNPLNCTGCAFLFGREYAAELQVKRAAETKNKRESDG